MIRLSFQFVGLCRLVLLCGFEPLQGWLKVLWRRWMSLKRAFEVCLNGCIRPAKPQQARWINQSTTTSQIHQQCRISARPAKNRPCKIYPRQKIPKKAPAQRLQSHFLCEFLFADFVGFESVVSFENLVNFVNSQSLDNSLNFANFLISKNFAYFVNFAHLENFANFAGFENLLNFLIFPNLPRFVNFALKSAKSNNRHALLRHFF